MATRWMTNGLHIFLVNTDPPADPDWSEYRVGQRWIVKHQRFSKGDGALLLASSLKPCATPAGAVAPPPMR